MTEDEKISRYQPAVKFGIGVVSVFLIALGISVAIFIYNDIEQPMIFGALSDWATFIFGSALGFAGAWVAIEIADLATKAQKNSVRLQGESNQLQETANKLQDPSYMEALHGANTLDSLKGTLATILSVMRNHKRDSAEMLAASDSPVRPLIARANELMLDPSWQGVFATFCSRLDPVKRIEFTSSVAAIVEHTLLFLSEHSKTEKDAVQKGEMLQKLITLIVYDAHKINRALRFSFEQMKENQDQSNDSLAPHDPARHLNKIIRGRDLFSFSAYEEAFLAVKGHYDNQTMATPLSSNELRTEVEKVLYGEQSVTHKLIYIFTEPGDSKTVAEINRVCGDLAREKGDTFMGHPPSFFSAGRSNRREYFRDVDTKSTLSLYHASGKNDALEFFGNSECLNKSVVVLDDFPNPPWENEFTDMLEGFRGYIGEELEDFEKEKKQYEEAKKNQDKEGSDRWPDRFLRSPGDDPTRYLLDRHFKPRSVSVRSIDTDLFPCNNSENHVVWIVLHELPSFISEVKPGGFESSPSLYLHRLAGHLGRVFETYSGINR